MKNFSRRRGFRGIVVFWVSWHGAALSRAKIFLFPSLFLSRLQAKPNPAAEQCMRVFMKWLSGNLHFVQRMPAPQCPHAGESKEIVSFCDASWGLDSVFRRYFCVPWMLYQVFSPESTESTGTIFRRSGDYFHSRHCKRNGIIRHATSNHDPRDPT